jgi:hypothetical protein
MLVVLTRADIDISLRRRRPISTTHIAGFRRLQGLRWRFQQGLEAAEDSHLDTIAL